MVNLMEEGIFIQRVNQTKSKQSVRMADYMGRSTQSTGKLSTTTP